MSSTRPVDDETGPAPPRLILVADDEPDIRTLLTLRLERRGFDVITAEDGHAALEAITHQAPDLVFMDVSMPGLSGIEVLNAVRERDLDTGVIIMTAFSSDQPAIEALRGGADDYLRKPFGTSDFEVVLDRTINRVELSRRNQWLQRELDDKRRQIEEELERAAIVQADLQPADTVDLPGFLIAGRCRPALQVGGDFYDWMVDGNRLKFVLADVMGKGMSAALLMATVRAALRAAYEGNTPMEALRRAAQAIEPDLLRSGRFVTLLIADVDLTTGVMEYVDAGHGYGFVLAEHGVEHLTTGGQPVGVIEGQSYTGGTTVVAPGDTVVIFSDGVCEVDESRTQSTFLAPLRSLDANAAVDRLTSIPAGIDQLSDDVTAIALHRRTA